MNDVLVLSDKNGNLYTITEEILRSVQVKDENHKRLIHQLTGVQDPSTLQPVNSSTELRVVGTFDRNSNPNISQIRDYFSPTINIQVSPAIPPS